MNYESTGNLMSRLIQRVGSRTKTAELLSKLRLELGLRSSIGIEPPLLALALCSVGTPPESVAPSLEWREFEEFCANLIRAAGLRVQENVFLKNPRSQIDLVAYHSSFVITVDCKHWSRPGGEASMTRSATAQLERSHRLRRLEPGERRPIVSVILTLSRENERFVGGVAVVPIFALRDFLQSVEAVSEQLSLA